MINYFSAEYSAEGVVKAVKNLPPEKWPPLDTIVMTMEDATDIQRKIVIRKVLEAYGARTHHARLSPKDQRNIWKLWDMLGTDAYGIPIREQYMTKRLNNDVMWLPEELRQSINTRSPEYRKLCREFFEKKDEEWKRKKMHTGATIEDWLSESRNEFLEEISKL